MGIDKKDNDFIPYSDIELEGSTCTYNDWQLSWYYMLKRIKIWLGLIGACYNGFPWTT